MRQGFITLHLGGKNQAQLHEITPPSSGWKSPVPYLFGGLAAVLGLIAVALLILAFSYCKLSGYQDNSSDPTSNEKHKDASHATTTTIAYMNSILVIMAGDEKPTFLATPVATSKASSFGDIDSSKASTSSGGCCDGGEDKEVKEEYLR